MPKSKRNKVVPLTKVKSKGREGKEDLVEKVQDSIGEYDNAYVINFENMRSGPFKQLQNQMHDSTRFFLGKNKVMIKALGKHPEDEF
jgi:mRNA turnover protein 4